MKLKPGYYLASLVRREAWVPHHGDTDTSVPPVYIAFKWTDTEQGQVDKIRARMDGLDMPAYTVTLLTTWVQFQTIKTVPDTCAAWANRKHAEDSLAVVELTAEEYEKLTEVPWCNLLIVQLCVSAEDVSFEAYTFEDRAIYMTLDLAGGLEEQNG